MNYETEMAEYRRKVQRRNKDTGRRASDLKQHKFFDWGFCVQVLILLILILILFS